MTKPRVRLPFIVQTDILRFLSFRWKPSLISQLMYRRYGLRVTRACVRAIRDDAPCPAACEGHCWARAIRKD